MVAPQRMDVYSFEPSIYEAPTGAGQTSFEVGVFKQFMRVTRFNNQEKIPDDDSDDGSEVFESRVCIPNLVIHPKQITF